MPGLQVFAVQALPSSQGGGGPPTQTPLTHVSPVVQALPSSQVPGSMTVVVEVAVLLALFDSAVRLEAVTVLDSEMFPRHWLTFTVMMNVKAPPLVKAWLLHEIVPFVPTTGVVQVQLPPVPDPVID